ncbi:MAG TPA: YafY family protein [Gaiellaceae bacterium]|nr:YafY family protein [Gaiellaceae bacterium]
MPTPTSRLLALLALLQESPLITGSQIGERLQIGPRTVRRYIASLEELGIPVEGQRGVGGGYRIRPGYRLPPLMLTNDEAIICSLGLLVARRLGLGGENDAAEGARSKLHRVLPTTLRRQVEALETSLGFTAPPLAGVPPQSDAVLELADAISRRRRVRLAYRSHEGERSQRRLSPYGLVVHSGRWYLAAHDHGRNELRSFRVDRIRRIAIVDGALHDPPADFDAVAHVSASLARVPWTWEIEVLLELPFDVARTRLPPTLAELEAAPTGTLLRMRVSSLDWMAAVLAGLDCDFAIHEPDELRDSVRALAKRLQASTSAGRLRARCPSRASSEA